MRCIMDKKILSEYVKEKVVTSPKKFGIEIEVEGCLNYKDDMLFWHVTEDASLRNNGKEFVSIPFLFPCLENVLGEIKPTLVKCVANARCGVHVHTSVEALTVEQYLKLLLYYMIY